MTGGVIWQRGPGPLSRLNSPTKRACGEQDQVREKLWGGSKRKGAWRAIGDLVFAELHLERWK